MSTRERVLKKVERSGRRGVEVVVAVGALILCSTGVVSGSLRSDQMKRDIHTFVARHI